jgi:hypothetical protein
VLTGVTIIYNLCAAMSLVCTVLLIRGYKKSGSRLLFWLSLSFAGLLFNNLFLVLDMVVYYDNPNVSLIIPRHLSTFFSAATLLYGFIWVGDQ